MANVTEQLMRFNTSGLSQTEADIVKEMLVMLGEETGSEWKPYHCGSIPGLTGIANQVYRKTEMPSFFGPIRPKRFRDDHYFWASAAEDGRILIIDPTGVPETYPIIGGNVVPYFGLLAKAPVSHSIVYKDMKDLTCQDLER